MRCYPLLPDRGPEIQALVALFFQEKNRKASHGRGWIWIEFCVTSKWCIVLLCLLFLKTSHVNISGRRVLKLGGISWLLEVVMACTWLLRSWPFSSGSTPERKMVFALYHSFYSLYFKLSLFTRKKIVTRWVDACWLNLLCDHFRILVPITLLCCAPETNKTFTSVYQ